MTTYKELVDSIHASLHSYTGVQEQVTYLSASADASTLTMSVGSQEAVQRGVAEIDDELIYVDNTGSSTLNLAPFGRGFRGSTAATHAQNAMVTYDPAFPRVEIKRAVQQVIAGLYPTLYRIKTTDITYSAAAYGHVLPADADKVIEAKWEAPAPTDLWQPISRWTFDPTSPETNGKVINIFDGVRPGATIRVVYQAKFGALSADADTLETTAGLSDSAADLIMYGVCARMVRFLEPARLQLPSVENLSRASVVQAGDSGRLANQLYAMYQQRLTEERKRLLELTPPQIHFTG